MPDESSVPANCKVVRKEEAFFRDKGNGTGVFYYVFPEYEIHKNRIEGHTTQEWHHHEHIVETVFVTAGEIEGRWVDGGRVRRERLRAGDVLEVGRTVHTVANVSDSAAEFLVFRFVPDGVDKRELVRTDRFPSTVVEE